MTILRAILLFVITGVQLLTGVSSVDDCPENHNFADMCDCINWELHCDYIGNHSVLPSLFDGTPAIVYSKPLAKVTVTNSTVHHLPQGAFTEIQTRELYLVDLQIRSIDVEAFGDLGDTLEGMYLSDNEIEQLLPGTLDNFQHLLILKLDDNRLTEISASSFQNLHELKNLYLHKNNIESLPADVFPTSLDSLTLYRNRMKDLPSQIFQHLNLSQLNIRENLLKYLPENLFSSLQNLRHLDISWNNLTRLQQNTFIYNSQLTLLDLALNSIDEIHEDTFNHLEKLTFLDLSHNRLQNISAKTFDGLTQLDTLLLVDNNIASLPANMSLRLSRLRTLNVQRNNLSYIFQESFAGLANLEVLKLDQNAITAIGFGAFDQLGALKVLDLSYNLLESLDDRTFISTQRLQDLRVSHNMIRYIGHLHFPHLRRLEHLDLSYNWISNISRNSFVDLESLIRLDLSHNWLQSIDSNIFRRNPSLDFISLASNPLSRVSPNVFMGLSSLKTLLLNRTCFSELPDNLFLDLSSLELLNLQHGQLRRLTNETFAGLDTVIELDVSLNAINSIESAAFDLLELQRLNLSYNNLRSADLRSTTSLLSYTVTTLDVSHNNITDLEGIWPQIFDRMSAVYFSFNPFTCDCTSNIYWLRSLVPFLDYQNASCHGGVNDGYRVVCFPDFCNHTGYETYPYEKSCNESDMTGADVDNPIIFNVCDLSRYTYPPEPTTPTTTTTTVESPSTSASPSSTEVSIPVNIVINVEVSPTKYKASVNWYLINDSGFNISGYIISSIDKQTGIGQMIDINNPDARQYIILHLKPNIEYEVCVQVEPNGGSDCQMILIENITTSKPAPPRRNNVITIIIVVAAITGCIIFVLVCTVMALYGCRKRNKGKNVGRKNKRSISDSDSDTKRHTDIGLDSLNTSARLGTGFDDITIEPQFDEDRRIRNSLDQKGNHRRRSVRNRTSQGELRMSVDQNGGRESVEVDGDGDGDGEATRAQLAEQSTLSLHISTPDVARTYNTPEVESTPPDYW